jgi:outer membrane protein assembly factor BamB
MVGCNCNTDCKSLQAQEKIVGNYDSNFYYDSKPLRNFKGVQWQYKTEGYGSFMPLVYDGVVYSGDDKGNLYALDAKSGKEKWIFKGDGRMFNGPSIKDGDVYFGTYHGKIYSLDVETGKENWEIQTGGSVCFPPIFQDKKGYALSHDNNLYIIDLISGTVIDTIKGDKSMCGVPSISSNHIYYPDWGGNLNSFNLKSKEKEWTFHTGSHEHRYTCPSFIDTTAYFVTLDSSLCAINLNTGKEFWNFKTNDIIVRSPAISNNLLALVTFNSHFYVVDRFKKETIWDFQSEGQTNSHPVIVSNVVYFSDGIGNLYAFDIQSGEKLWTHTFEAAVHTPFYSNGFLFVAGGNFIYCLQ